MLGYKKKKKMDKSCQIHDLANIHTATVSWLGLCHSLTDDYVIHSDLTLYSLSRREHVPDPMRVL